MLPENKIVYFEI